MNLDRLRIERPDILLSSEERVLVEGFDEPADDIREMFVDAIPRLLDIYAKKRKALQEGDEALWRVVLHEEAELVGGVV